jgi:hypothetical protein
MSTSANSLAERVQSSYLQLSAVASDLNIASDELGRCINDIDTALKKLNLGVEVWVQIRSGQEQDSPYYWSENIGYGKISGKWGVALCTRSGDYSSHEETGEGWLFNDAPRSLRLSAIEKIPDLLKRLSEEAVATTKKINEKLGAAQEVANAVKKAAWGGPPIETSKKRRIVGIADATEEAK